MGKIPDTNIVVANFIAEYTANTILVKKSKTHNFYQIPLMKLDISLTKDQCIKEWITRYVNARHNQFNNTGLGYTTEDQKKVKARKAKDKIRNKKKKYDF